MLLTFTRKHRCSPTCVCNGQICSAPQATCYRNCRALGSQQATDVFDACCMMHIYTAQSDLHNALTHAHGSHNCDMYMESLSHVKKEQKNPTSFAQPTTLITCANHGNNIPVHETWTDRGGGEWRGGGRGGQQCHMLQLTADQCFTAALVSS